MNTVGMRATCLVGLLCLAGLADAAPLILNEYNGVRADRFLNGGDALADDDGGLASDALFGRIRGNGGDWFELVVVADHLDIRGWRVVVDDDAGTTVSTLVFSQDALWSDLRAGTIVTVAEDIGEDVSYDPASGDWWIAVQAGATGSGAYISAAPFEVSNDNTIFEIMSDTARSVFGPTGEGVGAPPGVNSKEVAKLEADPGSTTEPDSLAYNDGTSSTFGSANVFNSGTAVQDYSSLRSGPPPEDLDFDGIADCEDNCQEQYNPNQTDVDGDDFGDACDADQGGIPGPGLPTEGCVVPDLYDPETLLEVEILVSKAVWNALRTEPRPSYDSLGPHCPIRPPDSPFEYVPADVVVNGVTVSNVGLRKKGFIGSINSTRPSLKIKFSEYYGNQNLYGLDRLTLNNAVTDPSKIKQCLGYGLFAAAGVRAPRCNFAHVRVTHEDGTEDLGVYANVESIGSRFLKRSFGGGEGNLYEGTRSDFRDEWIQTLAIKNNTQSNDGSDVHALKDVLQTVADTGLLAEVSQLVDVDDFLTFWAMEALIGHWDGYNGGANNFYVYADPSDGLFRFIPWGIDGTFAGGSPFFSEGAVAPLLWARTMLPWKLYRLASIRTDYQARMQLLFNTVWNEAAVLAEIDRMEALIAPLTGDLSSYINPVRSFVNSRRQKFVDDWTGSPPRWNDPLVVFLCCLTVQKCNPLILEECPACTPLSAHVRCQKTIAKAGADILKRRTKALQECRDSLNQGKTLYLDDAGTLPLAGPGDCDGETKVRAATVKAGAKARKKIAHRCSGETLGSLAACANTVDGLVNAAGNGGCLIESHFDGTDDMVRNQYGRSLLADETDLGSCQERIADAGRHYANKALKTLQKCRQSVAKGKSMFIDRSKTQPLSHSGDCASEYRTAKQIAKAGLKAHKLVAEPICSDTLMNELQACANTVDGVVAADGSTGCLIDRHLNEATTLARREFCTGFVCR